MRPLDRLFETFRDAGPVVRRLVLKQMDALLLDFEAPDALAFLALVEERSAASLALQAGRTHRILSLRRTALQDQLHEPVRVRNASGTWTEYNIDRQEIENRKLVGNAQSKDFTRVKLGELRDSGLHILAGPIGTLLDRCTSLPPAAIHSTMFALGELATPEAVDRIVECARLHLAPQGVASGALAQIGSNRAFEGCTEILAMTSDPEVTGVVLQDLACFVGRDRELRDILVPMLEKEPPVRIGAAGALVSLPRSMATPLLVSLLSDPEVEVVLWALESLARLGDPATVPDLTEVLRKSTDSWVSRMAVKAIGCTDTYRSFVALKECLSSSDPWIRTAAIEGLIKCRVTGDEVTRSIGPLLADSSPEVMASALLAVAPHDDAASGRALKGLLTAHGSDLARRLGAWCLGYLHGVRSLDVIAHLARTDVDPGVRLAAVKAVAKYGSRDAVSTLLQVMEHGEHRIRQLAARVVAHVGSDHERLEVPMLNALRAMMDRETEPGTRAELIRATARLHRKAYPLPRQWKAASTEIILSCLEVMNSYGEMEFRPELESFIDDRRPQVRAAAIQALWNLGEIAVAERLNRQLKSDEVTEVIAGVQALGSILGSLRRLEVSSRYGVLILQLMAHLKSHQLLGTGGRVADKEPTLPSPPGVPEAFSNTGIWTIQEIKALARAGLERASGHGHQPAEGLTPHEGAGPFVFLSYKHDDYERIHPHLVQATDWGHNIWYDRGIPGGAEWDALIEVKIQNCTLLLLFATQAAIESKWILREVKYADTKGKPILCVILEPVELKRGLDMLLTQYQIIDATRADFLSEFRRALTYLGHKQTP